MTDSSRGLESRNGVTVHETAVVSDDADVGSGTYIWHFCQVREGAHIGSNCILGKNVYIDLGVIIGSNVKIQNNSSLYYPLRIDDGVFVGPHVIFTNDRLPRAITPSGILKSSADWQTKLGRVCVGASLGAGAIVLPGLKVGAWALVGAGAVVTHDVPHHGIVIGSPARLVGYVCDCGDRLKIRHESYTCPSCGRSFTPSDRASSDR